MTEATTAETTTAETTGTAETTAATTTPPEWMANLPDELKADATLSRYADVEALARGHVEAHKVAKSKFAVPGEGATEEDWGKVWDALGRPADFDAYDVPTIELPVDAPEEARTALAETTKPFKELAHKIGLNQAQVTALGEFDLARGAASKAQGATEMAELKEQLGKDFEPKLEAAKKAFAKIFGDPNNDMDAAYINAVFDERIGSGAYVKGMMRIAELSGEHAIVESDNVEGFGEVADADAKLAELQKSDDWRTKLNAGDPVVTKQREQLVELAKRQAMRGRATAS